MGKVVHTNGVGAKVCSRLCLAGQRATGKTDKARTQGRKRRRGYWSVTGAKSVEQSPWIHKRSIEQT